MQTAGRIRNIPDEWNSYLQLAQVRELITIGNHEAHELFGPVSRARLRSRVSSMWHIGSLLRAKWPIGSYTPLEILLSGGLRRCMLAVCYSLCLPDRVPPRVVLMRQPQKSCYEHKTDASPRTAQPPATRQTAGHPPPSQDSSRAACGPVNPIAGTTLADTTIAAARAQMFLHWSGWGERAAGYQAFTRIQLRRLPAWWVSCADD